MKQHVILQVGRFTEAAAANVTSKRPETIMHVHVALQITRCRE